MPIQSRIDSARSVAGRRFSELVLPFSSIGDMLRSRAVETPDCTWLVYYDEHGARTTLTFWEFLRCVRRVAAFLLSRGITRGSRVATLGHNHSDTVIQYFAAWWIGATVVPLNAGEDEERLAWILENSGVTLAFVRGEYIDTAIACRSNLPALETIVVAGATDERFVTFSEIISHDPESLPDPVLDALGDECLIVYTSGTTGNPKGVLLAHGNLLADAQGISEWHGVTRDSRMMCVLPIHHVNGTVVTLVTPMFAGAGVVLNRKFQSGTFFPRLAAERVDIVSVVPTLLAFLVQADIDTTALDLGHFRHIICGAGPLTCELAARFEERYAVPIIHGYGLSETTCYSCFLPVGQDPRVHRAWMTDHGFPSIGVPIPQNEMAIHDEQGNPVAAGERGEIVIRGHNVMIEYYNNPPANEAAFTHGWFRSGDEGFHEIGEEGLPYFFITGRIKELIIRGGVNISPLEIDEVLNSHPGVDAGIAVAFENNWYGEEVGAYVRRSDPTLSEADLLAFCHTQLPFYKAPKVVIFGEDIPVTSTGKYQRNRVKSLFSDYRETQFQPSERGKM